MAATTAPNEETPLLGGQWVPVTGRIAEPEPEAAILASPPTQRNGNPSVRTTSSADERPDAVKKTPLPWAQLSIILFLRFAEALATQVISPFAPELVRSLNIAKDEAGVGYYVWIIQSLFCTTQACTVLHRWSRLSDRIGRKPVMLTGLFCLSLSMYCFALSKTYWGFVFSRALNGTLNGDIGMIRSMIHTNLSLAYSYQPISWSVGTTLGSFMGGALSRPAEWFPSTFDNIVDWLVAFFFLKETRPSQKPIRTFIRREAKRIGSAEDLLTSEASPKNQLEEPVPLRNLLT